MNHNWSCRNSIYIYTNEYTFLTNMKYFLLIFFAFLGLSISWNPILALSSHTSGQKNIPGSYQVFLESTMSGQAPISKAWVGISKLSLLSQCRALAKYKPDFLVRCTWQNTIIYTSRKTNLPLPTILSGASLSTTGSTEYGLYELYLNGKIILSTKELTKAQALKNCDTVVSANPLSETSCKWNAESIGWFIPSTEAVEVKLYGVKSSLKPYTFILKNTENEIGLFSLLSNSDQPKLKGLSLTNLWSTFLESIAENGSGANIIDLSTNTVVGTWSIVGNTITFSGMDNWLKKDILKNYKLTMKAWSLENNQSNSTLQFMMNPLDFVLISGTGNINPVGSTFQTIPYSVGMVPPTVTITNTNENTFKIHIVNPDTNSEITLSGISMDIKLTLPTGKIYTATACIQDIGNQDPCGTSSVPANYPFNSIYLPVVWLTTNTTLEKKEGFTEFELNLMSQNIFPTKWTIEVIIRSITYLYNGKLYTQNYYWNTWYSSKFAK